LHASDIDDLTEEGQIPLFASIVAGVVSVNWWKSI
jgi:hypothetical protein